RFSLQGPRSTGGAHPADISTARDNAFLRIDDPEVLDDLEMPAAGGPAAVRDSELPNRKERIEDTGGHGASRASILIGYPTSCEPTSIPVALRSTPRGSRGRVRRR